MPVPRQQSNINKVKPRTSLVSSTTSLSAVVRHRSTARLPRQECIVPYRYFEDTYLRGLEFLRWPRPNPYYKIVIQEPRQTTTVNCFVIALRWIQEHVQSYRPSGLCPRTNDSLYLNLGVQTWIGSDNHTWIKVMLHNCHMAPMLSSGSWKGYHWTFRSFAASFVESYDLPISLELSQNLIFYATNQPLVVLHHAMAP